MQQQSKQHVESVSATLKSLYNMDLPELGNMDPSLVEGYRDIFDRELPVLMKESAEAAGKVDTLRARVLLLGSEGSPDSVRIELSSESDIFFYCVATVDKAYYQLIQQQQHLLLPYAQFPSTLSRMFINCNEDPQRFSATLTIRSDPSSNGTLELVQKMDYKTTPLLSLNATIMSEAHSRQRIVFRYNQLKKKFLIESTKLQELTSLVKTKNPSLMLQLHRAQPSISAPAPQPAPLASSPLPAPLPQYLSSPISPNALTPSPGNTSNMSPPVSPSVAFSGPPSHSQAQSLSFQPGASPMSTDGALASQPKSAPKSAENGASAVKEESKEKKEEEDKEEEEEEEEKEERKQEAAKEEEKK